MEIWGFLGLVTVVVVVLMWRSRRGGDGDPVVPPLSVGDKPQGQLSVESTIAPHRSVGRTFRVDPGDRPTESDADIN